MREDNLRERLTIAAVILVEVGSDPEGGDNFVVHGECHPPQSLNNSTENDEFEPVAQSAERKQQGHERREVGYRCGATPGYSGIAGSESRVGSTIARDISIQCGQHLLRDVKI